MCKKLIFLISFVLVLITVESSSAEMAGHWRFDGDLNDSFGDAHGTFSTGSPTYVTGRMGQGIDFDGVSEYVHITLPNPSAYTITSWVRPARTDAASIIVRTSASGQTTHWSHQLRINPQGTFHHYLWVGSERNIAGSTLVEADEWYHVAIAAENDGPMHLYVNGEEDATSINIAGTLWGEGDRYYVGSNSGHNMGWFQGVVDDVQIYDSILTAEEVEKIAASSGGFPLAFAPSPKDGTLYADTWVSLSWRAGDLAVSHDVYFGENFDDVNDSTDDTFRGNQELEYFVVGFPGFPYPDGLVPGTTYYWRIDEVNETEPNSPWKGDVWSFSIPPKTAYYPDPADGAEFVDLNVQLEWTAGFGTKLHYVVFGEDYDEVSNATMGIPNGTSNYSPGPLNLAKTYYWRVDEFDGIETYKGEVWSFTTQGAASSANPANGAVDVKPSAVLRWDAGIVAASHEVYFGTDADAIKNATTTSPEYKGAMALGEESYDPGKLEFNTAYYWRIDEVNAASTDSPWAGVVWSFTTGDFFVIDDFEDYDTGDNQIWYAWHDGLGYGAVGTDPYFAGNGTGAAVGDETTPSYTEETIVHGGGKSMPVSYDNNKQGFAFYSEVEHKLTAQRDWTEGGVGELSIWFRGRSENGVEPLYVAVSNSSGASAVVVHDDPTAAATDTWTQWIIPLSAFADKGINLGDVDEIAIGMGTQGNLTAPGGSGKMYFDDIRLCQPREAL